MRMFYKTLIRVEILTEDPYDPDDLGQVLEDITTGDASGKVTVDRSECVDGETMARLLIEQGSDPGFFQLTDSGEDDSD